jgi:hypothetical protein
MTGRDEVVPGVVGVLDIDEVPLDEVCEVRLGVGKEYRIAATAAPRSKKSGK